MTMNGVFPATNSPASQAPKRSNSGREIMYIQNHRVVGSGQAVQDPFASQQSSQFASAAIPPDVAEVFNTVLRNYAYHDLQRWLRLDRQDELARYPSQFHAVEHVPSHMARPSIASSARTSRTSSVFSMGAGYDRNSYASSRTSYSMISEHDPESLMSPSMMGNALGLDGTPAGLMSRNSTASRSSTISTKQAAKQRENDLEVKKRYFCTACNKGFARKYDWKVHEQRYHEQQFQYPCPDCNQILYAETHFRSHHRDAHGCQQCTHAKEVTKEVDPRRRRTAWGCGFCAALLEDWEKRCDHISQHYDEGMKRTEWEHTKVILGLLRQDGLDAAWQNHLIAKHGHTPNPPLAVRFSKETTARSHGDNLQLQDLLELGAIGRDINAIVELAYDHGVLNAQAEPSKPLDTVKEEQETSSITPPTDAPQDSVMGSPPMEAVSLPPSSQFFVSSPMEFTAQPQAEVQPTSMGMDNSSMHMFTFNGNGFDEPIYQASQFMPSHHQSMPPYTEKALPPIPVESDVTMLQSQAGNDSHSAHFDQWSILTGSTFTTDSSGMVVPIYDPRNQI